MAMEPDVATVPAAVAEAARRRELEPDFPVEYAARVRGAAAALALGDEGDAELRHAAASLEDAATVDVDVPLAGATRSRRFVKLLVKKTVGWYLRFVGDQVSVLGRAAARLGLVVAERVERIDAETAGLRSETATLQSETAELRSQTASLQAEVGRLRERVAELEAARR